MPSRSTPGRARGEAEYGGTALYRALLDQLPAASPRDHGLHAALLSLGWAAAVGLPAQLQTGHWHFNDRLLKLASRYADADCIFGAAQNPEAFTSLQENGITIARISRQL